MKIRNFLINHGLIRDELKEINDWIDSEQQSIVNGKEIEPPWKHLEENETSASISWAKENCPKDLWESEVWRFFWENLSDEKKREYIEKWQPPIDWYQNLVYKRFSSHQEKIDWFNNQKRKLKNKEEIEPPWITFPVSVPYFGWDEENTERWKLEIWTPFWDRLSETEQEEYLKKWQSPDEEWKKNITQYWTGRIGKTEDWFKRQKITSEFGYMYNGKFYNKYITQLPWHAFPQIQSKKTNWSNEGKERWLEEIWLPFWNAMSDEEQNEYLKYVESSDNEWMEILAHYKVKNFHKLKELKSS